MRFRRLLPLALFVCAAPAFAQGTLIVTNTSDSGPGSLRQAITTANTTPGAQTIAFNIPTTDPNFSGTTFYITPQDFPSYTLTDDGTTVDGTTQTAFTGDTNPAGPEITMFGNVIAPELRAFIVRSDDNVIRGFEGFLLFRYGIEIMGNNNRVEGCSFRQSYSAAVNISGDNNTIGGTAPGTGNDLASSGVGIEIEPVFGSTEVPTGNVIQGNDISGNHSGGIQVEGGGTVIGGADPAARNYIYSNGHSSGEQNPVGFHVELFGEANVLQGNWIGLNTEGNDSSGLAADAVRVDGSNHSIVGNVIGGMEAYDSQARAAVRVSGGTGHVVRGNLLGLDPTGTLPRPNTFGVVVTGGSATVGGTALGDGNTIAYNQTEGVAVTGFPAPTGVAVLGNAMFENGALGIDLGRNGATANDARDPDTGANRFQNHPVIEVASLSGSALTVTYAVDTAPANAAYPLRVEFFRADASGLEGQVFLGADTYTAADYGAGQPGPKTATFDVGGSGLGVGDLVVATATDAAGNTSEFGAAEAVVSGGAIITVSAEPVGGPVTIGAGGGAFQFTVTLTNTTAQPQTFEAWTAVAGPVARPLVLGPVSATLPPNGTITRTLTQQVPRAAPAGTYTYGVNVGDYPGVVASSASFPVVKEGALARAAASSTSDAEWPVSGWDESASASATALPEGYALSEVHPNPARGRAALTLEIAEAQRVTVEVFDALGRRVAVLHDGALEAGAHALRLDASRLPSGVYVVRVTGETFTAARRVTTLS